MKTTKWLVSLLAGLLLVVAVGRMLWSAEAAPSPEQRQKYQKLLKDGNFKDAYDGFRKMALDKDDEPGKVGGDLTAAIECLNRLGRTNEIDDFREQVIALHKDNWRLLWTAAKTFRDEPHYGFMIAGKFYRGNQRGGGQPVNAQARDRVRSLQLMQQAMPLAQKDDDANAKGNFFISFSHMLVSEGPGRPMGRFRGAMAADSGDDSGPIDYSSAWRLQVLTDLKELPDYDQGWYMGGETRGRSGRCRRQPSLLHRTQALGRRHQRRPASALGIGRSGGNVAREIEHLPDGIGRVSAQPIRRANDGSIRLFGGETDEEQPQKTGPYAVQTLADDETIARLATGIKRFKLPDEFNFIKIYQQIADEPKTGHGAEAALGSARPHFREPPAISIVRPTIGGGPSRNTAPAKTTTARPACDQIVGNWGRFEPIISQPAGQGARPSISASQRPAASASRPTRSKSKTLLDDVKAYLKSKPESVRLAENRTCSDIGYPARGGESAAVSRRKSRRVGFGPQAAARAFRPPHHCRHAAAKSRSVSAHRQNGRRQHQPHHRLARRHGYRPQAAGRRQCSISRPTPSPDSRWPKSISNFSASANAGSATELSGDFDTLNFAEQTDADGQATSRRSPSRKRPNISWLDRRPRPPRAGLAYFGFTQCLVCRNITDADYNEPKVFTITDRPGLSPRPEREIQILGAAREVRSA